ncbi:MAG: ATP-binding cassette domain-containing protein, partial [Betaproteobacteria bacterium]|nr:ATP-binding cassette domain-containing protein [Betaproteobacteria bacterium]
MFLDVSQLQVQYPGRVQPAVDQVTLGLRAGEMGVLIGPSGCGKTTLLRSVAGLEPVTRGRIRLNGQVVSERGLHVPAEQR